MPDFAINFVYGDDLSVAFDDERYFTFHLQQVTVFKNPNLPRIYEDMVLADCNKI